MIFKNDESNKLVLEQKLKRSIQAWRLFIVFDMFNDINNNESLKVSLDISHNGKVGCFNADTLNNGLCFCVCQKGIVAP